MRFSVLKSGHLWRGAAIAVLAGLGAGCSSDFSRFAPTSSDNLYTGSINQQQIIHKQSAPAQQAFPSNVAPTQPVAAAPSYDYQSAPVGQPMYTGTVGEDGTIRSKVSNASGDIKRKVLAPVAGTGAALATGASKLKDGASNTMSAARRAVTPLSVEEEITEPVVAVKKKAAAVDGTVTGTVAKAKAASDTVRQPMPEVKSVASETVAKVKTVKDGWSKTNGITVTAREGDTISHLANRYGVPMKAIIEANGLPANGALRSGTKVLIPTYTSASVAKKQAEQAPVEVSQAKPVKIAEPQVPVKKLPVPDQEPKHDQVAVLPTTPELKVKKTEATQAVASDESKVEQPGIKVLSKKTKSSASGGYTVASGDSLYTIAKKNGTTVDALKAANGLADGKLKIGQKLVMPSGGAVVAAVAPAKAAAAAKLPAIDPVTTGSATSSTPKKAPVVEPMPSAKAEITPSKAVIEEAEKDTAQAPGSTGISKLRWPVKGRTLTGYGQADAGKVNDGVDISVPNGTPVKAAENGVVIYAGTGLKDFGNTVLIRHDNGLVTVYGHAGDITVKRGDTVKRGQEVAKSGMSGNTKVPKLHFEVRKDSKPVNPATFLE